MRQRNVVAVVVVSLLLAACGTSSGSEGSAESVEATIAIEDFSFGEPIEISVGDELTVINEDSVSHTWTSVGDLFDSGSIAPDGEFSFVFDDSGEYEFFCSIHPTMKGSILVSG